MRGRTTPDRRWRNAAAALLAAAVFGCGGGPAATPPDVVLVTLDTLRSDHVGAYGGSASTPTLDGLAAEGVVFEHVVAPLPETRPSHASILTSRYPRDTTVVSNSHTLPDDAVSLPEVFRQSGYRTAAVVGCALFGPESGFQQGFDRFADTPTPQRPSHEVVPLAREWLAGVGPDQPFFLWLHLFDPHMPYEPPAPSPVGPGEADLDAFTWPGLLAAAERNDGNVPAPMLRRALTLYRDEVEHMDAQLGLLLGDLRARPRWTRTIVLAAADHGECFSNGIYFDHSYCLGEGALAVPLILRAPGVPAGGREAGVVELLDVAPTLLRLSGLQVPSAFTGRGLLTRTGGAPSDAFFQHPFYRADALAGRLKIFDTLKAVAGEPVRPVSGDRLEAGVRRRQLKLVVAGDDRALYDLDADPAETDDLADTRPDEADALEAALHAWLATSPMEATDPDTINPELRRKLEALGYL
jgi:arylsulfatase A-like enzyme